MNIPGKPLAAFRKLQSTPWNSDEWNAAMADFRAEQERGVAEMWRAIDEGRPLDFTRDYRRNDPASDEYLKSIDCEGDGGRGALDERGER